MPGGGRRIGQHQRVVPGQRVGFVVEPRTVVAGAEHRFVVRPLEAHVQVVGAGPVGQRDLVVVAEPEACPPRQLPRVLRRREAAGEVDVGRRCGADAKRADLAALAQVELRRDRWVDVEVRLALRVVVQQQHPRSALDERGARIDAVELRDLVKESVDFEEADPFVGAAVALVAPADVVGAEAAVPVGRFVQHASLREQQPVAKVLVALPARRVARDAAHTTGELEHVRAGLEQTRRVFGERTRASPPAARLVGGGGLVCGGGGGWVLGVAAPACASGRRPAAPGRRATASGPHTRERNSRIRVALTA